MFTPLRIGVLAAIATLAAFVWYFFLDGRIPAESRYLLEIGTVRTLASADRDTLPTEIRMEVLSRNQVPHAALRAGGGFDRLTMARAVFQIIGPAQTVILETGMDRALAEKYNQAGGFSDEAWRSVQDAMSEADLILVTHEHPDHIGGLVRHDAPGKLKDKMVLTAAQFAGLGKYTESGSIPPVFSDYVPVTFERYLRVAPGIVMIKAPGHTPGSVMIYVRLRSGQEILFIGDIAYVLENVTLAVDRPRFTRWFMVSREDVQAVRHELRALHNLSKAEPEMIIMPAHDDAHLNGLVKGGVLKEGFRHVRP